MRAAGDRRYTPDSRGAVLFREYLWQFPDRDLVDAGALYRTPFDPADPVGTPNTANDTRDVELLANLGVAAKALTARGIALDVRLADLQVDGRLADGAPPGWRKLGENVGMGGSISSVHVAYMDSPGHRANVLDPAFTQIGTAAVWGDCTIKGRTYRMGFTVHGFMA